MAPVVSPAPPHGPGRVAAFFSGGVDSWSTIIDHPEITDLIFVRGFDLLPTAMDKIELADQVELRLREVARALGLQLHVVETNLREFSDPLSQWETYFGCAAATVALFLAPLFERIYIAGDSDHEVQVPEGANRLVDQLWSTEQLEIVDDGGRFSRVERLKRIVDHPYVKQTLRVCWENPDGAYNCGRCRKCLLTMLSLEALGAREKIATFPTELDCTLVPKVEINRPVLLSLWEDLLDLVRSAGRPDLERIVEGAVAKGKSRLRLPVTYRRRRIPGPRPTVRIGVIIPVWRQPQYLAAAVKSTLEQELPPGVGVVIVNDGCPFESTHRIGQIFCDAYPDRVAYLRQPNRGVSSARNSGIKHALARWPHLETIFPLDADNLLSPKTLAMLWEQLEGHPEVAWVSPVLEFFNAEEGEWNVPSPYLSYRQLFANQSDSGSLIRRSVFEAGIKFDETITEGFEDWEFFLHATLVGFRGAQAGRCGFRYRRRPHSMLTTSISQAETIEAKLRRRHQEAYRPASLSRREHAEAPRFALIRCDRADVLLTACCNLDAHYQSLATFAQTISTPDRGRPPSDGHIPAVTILTTSGTIDWLERHKLLAGVLLRIQIELRDHATVGLRIGQEGNFASRAPDERLSVGASDLLAVASRTRTLSNLVLNSPNLQAERIVDILPGVGDAPEPLPDAWWRPTLAFMARRSYLSKMLQVKGPCSTIDSHSLFFETRHIDALETTVPWCGEEGATMLLALTPRTAETAAFRTLFRLVSAMRSLNPQLSAHLILTSSTTFEATSALEAPFDTVTSLGGVDPGAATRVLQHILGDMDAIVHVGTTDGIALVPRISERQRGAQIVLDTISEPADLGAHGYLLAREYEPLVDSYITTSTRAGHHLGQLSVVPDKIVIAEPPLNGASEADWTVAARTVLETVEMATSTVDPRVQVDYPKWPTRVGSA
jgi:Glycosyl transferase family 2